MPFSMSVCKAAFCFNEFLFSKTCGTWARPGKHLQADETVLRGVKTQDPRGRKRSRPQWLCGFCEVDTLSGKTLRVGPPSLLAQNEGRKKVLVVPGIVAAACENSVVITDELRSYMCLDEFIPGVLHGSVCHKREFVNALGQHTNNIERCWGAMKDIMEQLWPRNWSRGDDDELVSRAHLATLLYNASLSGSDPFATLLSAIKLSVSDD